MARYEIDIYSSGDKIGRVKENPRLPILNAAIRTDVSKHSQRLKNISYNAAIKARARMIGEAPSSAGQPGGKPAGSANTLKNAIDVVGDKATYRPAGRGGLYETKVVIDQKKAPHARFVIRGTGLYNPNRRGYIFPKKKKFMSFPNGYKGQKSDLTEGGQRIYDFGMGYNNQSLLRQMTQEQINRRAAGLDYSKPNLSDSMYANNAVAYKTRGQRPNNDFIVAGRRRANAYIREALRYSDLNPN